MRPSFAKIWPVACVGLLIATSLAPQDPKQSTKTGQSPKVKDSAGATVPPMPGPERSPFGVEGMQEPGRKNRVQAPEGLDPGAIPPPQFLDGPTPARKVPLPDPAEAEAAVKPSALTPIPDNPPPHEGKTFAIPYRIEPPDLIIIEVLDALPGRQILGERLVRPDGTISLGFYGDIHVADLTVEEIKEKTIHHLRTFLPFSN